MALTDAKFRAAAGAYLIYGIVYWVGGVYLAWHGVGVRGEAARAGVAWIVVGLVLALGIPALLSRRRAWFERWVLSRRDFARVLTGPHGVPRLARGEGGAAAQDRLGRRALGRRDHLQARRRRVLRRDRGGAGARRARGVATRGSRVVNDAVRSVAGLRALASGLVLAAALLAIPGSSGAQPEKLYRIGYLQTSRRDQQTHLVRAFEDGLRDLGYVVGRNLVIEYRFAEGNLDRLPKLAGDLVRLKVDVIVTGTNPNAIAAKRATTTIPIVMTTSVDPVGAGLVATVARPGGNVTGLTQDVGAEIWGKRLALLKEFVPRLTRVAVLTDPGFPPVPAIFKALEGPAQTLGMTVARFDAGGPADLEGAFAALTQARSGAVFTTGGAVHFNMRNEIAQLALRNRLSMMSTISEWVEAGGLMSYGASLSDQWRRAAGYVDKILKGAKAGDLPIEQPTKFELVVNARTAKALGLAIPPSVRLQADRIVE